MNVLHRRCRLLLILILILCFMTPSSAMALHSKDEPHTNLEDCAFSILILGDSQMSGAGWKGGYANCIEEAYPDARVLNLAQKGSLLANGDIFEQWEFYLSEGFDMPHFVLLDGGFNDLARIKAEKYDDELLELVREALCLLIEQIHDASPDTHIIYTLMPPLVEWKDSKGGSPSYDIQERYWKIMSNTANEYRYVTVLDMFSINPFHYPCSACFKEYFSDSLHLNEAGYRKTFEYIDNVLLACLARMLGE